MHIIIIIIILQVMSNRLVESFSSNYLGVDDNRYMDILQNVSADQCTMYAAEDFYAWVVVARARGYPGGRGKCLDPLSTCAFYDTNSRMINVSPTDRQTCVISVSFSHWWWDLDSRESFHADHWLWLESSLTQLNDNRRTLSMIMWDLEQCPGAANWIHAVCNQCDPVNPLVSPVVSRAGQSVVSNDRWPTAHVRLQTDRHCHHASK